MSFRITARNYEVGENYEGEGDKYAQVYGNYEFPEQLEAYLSSKGVEFDVDGCFRDYEVTDIQELMEVMLVIHNEQVKDDSYWDFKPSKRYKINTPEGLMSYIAFKLDCAVVMQMYNFYETFRDYIDIYWNEKNERIEYKLNGKGKIYLSGF